MRAPSICNVLVALFVFWVGCLCTLGFRLLKRCKTTWKNPSLKCRDAERALGRVRRKKERRWERKRESKRAKDRVRERDGRRERWAEILREREREIQEEVFIFSICPSPHFEAGHVMNRAGWCVGAGQLLDRNTYGYFRGRTRSRVRDQRPRRKTYEDNTFRATWRYLWNGVRRLSSVLLWPFSVLFFSHLRCFPSHGCQVQGQGPRTRRCGGFSL